MFERLPPSRRFFAYICIFIACILGSFIIISTRISSFHSKKYVVYFDRSISGLKVGNSIYYKGISVGMVDSIKVELPEAKRVKIVVKISKKIPLYEGCVAKIGMQGLTGHSVLELNNGTSRQLLQGTMPEIKSEYSTVERLFDDIPRLIADVNGLVIVTRDILVQNRKNIGISVANFSKVLLSLNATLEELQVAVGMVNKCGKRFEVNVMPKAEEAMQDLAALMHACRKDWQAFSTGGMVQLMDLINNLNNVTMHIQESISSEKSYLSYLLSY